LPRGIGLRTQPRLSHKETQTARNSTLSAWNAYSMAASHAKTSTLEELYLTESVGARKYLSCFFCAPYTFFRG